MKQSQSHVLLLLLAFSICLVAGPAVSRSWQAQTSAGRRVDAHNYCSGLRKVTCSETGVPQIDIVSGPNSGSISFGNSISSNVFTRVGEERVGKQCPQLPRHCIQILYTPVAGFHGADHFSYTVANPGGQFWHDDLTVVVH